MAIVSLQIPTHAGGEDGPTVLSDLQSDMADIQTSNNDIETRQLVVDGAAAQVTSDAAQVAADKVTVVAAKDEAVATKLIASGTATAGSATTLTDTAAVMGVNAHAGLLIKIYTSAGALKRAEAIVSNTATAWTFATGTAVVAGDTYQVYSLGQQSLSSVINVQSDYGFVGNISNPLVDLPLNQLELLPFASGTFVSTTAATAVPNYPLRTATLSLSGGTPIPSVAAGQFVAMGGNTYHITAVSGGDVTVEYSIDLADPVAGDAIFAIWRMAGKYAGTTSFTRASRKTYIDPLSGLLRAVPAGFPALERMANGKVGYLSEGASTNLFLQSQNLTNAQWGVPANATATANDVAVVDPMGGSAATTYTEDATATAARPLFSKLVFGLAPNGARCFSIFVPAISAGRHLNVWLDGTGAGNTVSYNIDMLAGTVTQVALNTLYWSSPSAGFVKVAGGYRVWIAATDNFGTTLCQARVYMNLTGGVENQYGTTIYTGDGVSSISFFGAQFEQLPFATSYIPTTTAIVTRVGDYLTIPLSGNRPFASDDATTILDFDVLGLPAAGIYMRTHTADYQVTNFQASAYFTNTGTIFNYYGAALNSSAVVSNTVLRLAQVVNNKVLSVAEDGVTQAATMALTAPSVTVYGVFAIGSSITPGVQTVYGHIGALKIYDHALTASEISAA